MGRQIDPLHERLIQAAFDEEVDAALGRPSTPGGITQANDARSFPAAGDANPEKSG